MDFDHIDHEKEYQPDPAMVDLFRVECFERAEVVDPGSEMDWLSLTLGWAIGKGMSPVDANSFAIYIRYNTDLG